MYPPELAEPAPYVKELARGLSKNHKVSVVAYASTSEYTPHVNLFATSKHLPLPLRFIAYTYSLYHASKNSDIIFTQATPTVSIPSILVGKLLGIPVVVRYLEDEPWKQSNIRNLVNESPEIFRNTKQENLLVRLFLFLEKITLDKADLIITSTRHQKEFLQSFYQLQNEKVTTVYNPTQKEEKLPFAYHLTTHQIITNTNLTQWSNVATIIQSVALLKKEFPDIKLIIASDGPEKENLLALAQKLSISENVVFKGRISKAEAWHLRKTSQIYIEPSFEERESLEKTLWSLLAEIPVIVEKSNTSLEFITDNETGLLFEKNNPESLAQKIRALFNGDDLKEKITKNGTLMIQKDFSWEDHILKLSTILEQHKKNV